MRVKLLSAGHDGQHFTLRFIGPDGSAVHLSLTGEELARVNAIAALMLDQHAAREQFGGSETPGDGEAAASRRPHP